MTGDGNDADRREARIASVLDGYFDTRVGDLVRRVVATATPDELASDERMDAFRDVLLARIRERFTHSDRGWNDEAELLIHTEWANAVAKDRAFLDAFDDPG